MTDGLRDWLIARCDEGKSESPMEALLFAGWELMISYNGVSPGAGLKVEQQAQVGPYRADFLFTVNEIETGNPKQLVVEVDGHDFHERTKEQAAHDKRRDRWMAEQHYAVMRFTGSEVWANPFACAEEVISRLHILRRGQSKKEAIARAGFEAIRTMLEGGQPNA